MALCFFQIRQISVFSQSINMPSKYYRLYRNIPLKKKKKNWGICEGAPWGIIYAPRSNNQEQATEHIHSHWSRNWGNINEKKYLC